MVGVAEKTNRLLTLLPFQVWYVRRNAVFSTAPPSVPELGGATPFISFSLEKKIREEKMKKAVQKWMGKRSMKRKRKKENGKGGFLFFYFCSLTLIITAAGEVFFYFWVFDWKSGKCKNVDCVSHERDDVISRRPSVI